MAAAGVAAIAPALAMLAGQGIQAVNNQGRAPTATLPARVDTSTAAIAGIREPKARRAAYRNAREERLMALITDPQVMGALVTVGGMLVATHLPFSEDRITNARLQGVAAAACVLMGLGRAGVGDITTAAFAAGAGTLVGTSQGLGNVPGTNVGIADLGLAAMPGGIPIVLARLLSNLAE